jgi:hypothetical protein
LLVAAVSAAESSAVRVVPAADVPVAAVPVMARSVTEVANTEVTRIGPLLNEVTRPVRA